MHSPQQTLPQNLPNKPAVVFTFDDGYANNYTLAYPALSARNINATIYMITNWIDGGAGAYLTTAQLQALNTAGWDIANHTIDHPDMRTLTEAQQEAELTGAQAVLDGLGLNRASKQVAYPSGYYNADTLTAMANTGMLTGRTILTTYNDIFDMATVAWYEIMPIRVANTTTLAQVKELISWASCNGKIAMLVFHNIIDGGVAANNEWQVSDLAALADWINAQYLPTLTISQLHTLRSGDLVYDNPWYS